MMSSSFLFLDSNSSMSILENSSHTFQIIEAYPLPNPSNNGSFPKGGKHITTFKKL